MDTNQATLIGFIFTVSTFLGFLLAYIYGKDTKEFKWGEYVALFFFPLCEVLVLAYFYEPRILSLYLISAFLGFFIEYITGFTYHKVENRRLWTYHRLSVDGYTSLLTPPVWGIMGLIFWFIAKMLGL